MTQIKVVPRNFSSLQFFAGTFYFLEDRENYNLALIYESNNRDKAKELYIEVLEQDPSFEEAKNALADLATSDFY